MFKENQVHFIVMLALIFGLSVMKHKSRYPQFFGFNFLKNRKIHFILATFLSTFIAVQINHQISSPGNDWKSLNQLDGIAGFKESKLLTSQEVEFPLALFANYQVLDHGELQSVIYVPENLQYAESKLRTYYGTNLAEYFAQSSCALAENPYTRKLWESWEPAVWQKLAATDGFRFVIVPSDWKLQIKRANLEEIALGNRVLTYVSVYRVY
jgi:hypothetical protein